MPLMKSKKKGSQKQSKTFLPPLAMQRPLWNSIAEGNFIDTKIFAFSRRSGEPGRVDTPKALFANAHVLASSCSYFESTFSFSDGIETGLNEGLPPSVEPFFDLEGCDIESDFEDPAEDTSPTESQEPQAPPEGSVSPPPQSKGLVKTYIVKYTAYKTLRAIIWYIYTGEISFSNDSKEVPSASAKSVYRFADEHRMGHLKSLASEAIKTSINQLSPSEFVEEVCSISCTAFISRYPEWKFPYVERLSAVLSTDWDAKSAFRKKSSAYFSGEVPHCKDIVPAAFLCLLDLPTFRRTCSVLVDDPTPILRVSRPWSDWIRRPLLASLDDGTFDGPRVSTSDPQTRTTRPIHLPPAFMTIVGQNAIISASNSGFSLLTWQAVVYYKYSDDITFKPFGLDTSPELSVDQDTPDVHFQGYPCPMKEAYHLATRLRFYGLSDVVTEKMDTSLTPENVIEEMFSGLSLPRSVINRGLQVIRGSGDHSKERICSGLGQMFEEAAGGSKLHNFSTFWDCFDQLTPQPFPPPDSSDF